MSELKENKSAVEDQGIRIRLEGEALSRLRVKGAIGGKSEQVVRTKCFSWHSYALGHRLSCLWSHALSYAAQCASYCAHWLLLGDIIQRVEVFVELALVLNGAGQLVEALKELHLFVRESDREIKIVVF